MRFILYIFLAAHFIHAFDLDQYKQTYEIAKFKYMQALQDLKDATPPYKAAAAAYKAATQSIATEMYEETNQRDKVNIRQEYKQVMIQCVENIRHIEENTNHIKRYYNFYKNAEEIIMNYNEDLHSEQMRCNRAKQHYEYILKRN